MKIFIFLMASVAVAVAQSSYYDPYQASSTTRRPYVAGVTTAAPTAFSSYGSSNFGLSPYNSYQQNPLYNTPYITPEPYRSYQTSSTNLRPYHSNLGLTSGPLYNSQYRFSQPYSPYQINQDSIYNRFYDYGVAGQAQGLFPGSNQFQIANDVFGASSWYGGNGELVPFPYSASGNGYYPQTTFLGAKK